MEKETITAIGGGLQGLGQGLFGLFQAKKGRQFQREMAATAYQRDTEAWQNANKYNAPEAQMERLKKAGLNPNMVYGTGTVTGNTSTATPKHQSYDTPVAQVSDMPDFMDIIGKFADIKSKTLSNDAQAATNRYINSKLEAETGKSWNEYKKGTIDVNNPETLKGSWPILTGSPYHRKSQEQVKGANLDNQLKQVNVDFYKNIPKQYQFMAPLIMKLIAH